MSETSFCFFCSPDAKKLREEIRDLLKQNSRLQDLISMIEENNEEMFQRLSALELDTNINDVSISKEKLIVVVKNALIARNMTKGEANNLIGLLLK